MGAMATNWLMEESYSVLKISDLLYFKPFYQLQNKKRKSAWNRFPVSKKSQKQLGNVFLKQESCLTKFHFLIT